MRLFFSILLIFFSVMLLEGVGDGITRILIIGDSTVADYPENNELDIYGWGQSIRSCFDEGVKIVNLSRSGVSSKSYIEKGYWERAKKEQADFIFIQFGHNDVPGKEARSTSPDSDYMKNLEKMVIESRRHKMVPILVTPVARRTYRDHKLYSSLKPYANAMKRVGDELGVVVIDLHEESLKLYRERGRDNLRDLAPKSYDITHFSLEGANILAEIIRNKLSKAELPNDTFLERVRKDCD